MVQKSPLQASTAQYSPSSLLTLSHLNLIFLFRNRIVYFVLFGECLNYKSGLRTLIWPLEVPFFWSKNGHFCQKCQSLRPQKWHFEWPNQNSKTTFIVQTFPKYGPYDFYLVNLSLLGAILAIFQFCGFSGLFWPFFPCNCNV